MIHAFDDINIYISHTLFLTLCVLLCVENISCVAYYPLYYSSDMQNRKEVSSLINYYIRLYICSNERIFQVIKYY